MFELLLLVTFYFCHFPPAYCFPVSSSVWDVYVSTPSFARSLLHLPLRVVVVACPFACPAFPVLLLHRTLPSFPPLLLLHPHPDRGRQTARRSQAACPRRWRVCCPGAAPASQRSLPALYVSVSGWNRSVLMGRTLAAHHRHRHLKLHKMGSFL